MVDDLRGKGRDLPEVGQYPVDAFTCPWCERGITQPRTGRHRIWCTDRCRRDANAARRAARSGHVGMTVVRQNTGGIREVKVTEILTETRVVWPSAEELEGAGYLRRSDTEELLAVVLANDAATARVLETIADRARNGTLGERAWSMLRAKVADLSEAARGRKEVAAQSVPVRVRQPAPHRSRAQRRAANRRK